MDAQQLIQVEALCETLYTGKTATSETGEPISRADAQARLLSLQSSADYIHGSSAFNRPPTTFRSVNTF